MNLIKTPPNMLCGHSFENTSEKSGILHCCVCHSFWDLKSYHLNNVFLNDYPADYPLLRSHYDEDTGSNKVQTYKMWQKKLNLNIKDKIVCEVGFGGGYVLKYISQTARDYVGIEAVKENINFATNSHLLDQNKLFLFSNLPKYLGCKIDLWIFLDSFEHILEPAAFLDFIKNNSAQNAQVLIIAPRADSLTQTLMGKYWVHRGADHLFHWSSKGLDDFFESYGFKLKIKFYPLKVISLKTIVMHLITKLGFKMNTHNLLKRLIKLPLLLNFGEQGKLYIRY